MLVNNQFANKYYAVLDKLNIDTTIEIGAYDAEFSDHMSNKINGRKVWAFEALPNIYNEFKSKLSHINYINLAISDSEQEVVIGELDPDEKLGILSGASSILTRVKTLKTTPVTVKANTVDNLVSKFGIEGNIALWIDCEGANKEVLSGSINTLKNVVAIYIEVELSQVWENAWLKQDTVTFLNNNGFELIDSSYGTIQQDLIFVRKDLLPLA